MLRRDIPPELFYPDTMRYLLITAGGILLLYSGIYFIRLIHYLSTGAFALSSYGKGVLAGRIILFLVGLALLLWGLKKRKGSRESL